MSCRSSFSFMPAMVLPVLMITSGRPCQGPGLELLIRPEVSDDHQAVRDLHLAAFPDDESVATLVAALRTASAPLAPKSFVATISRQVVGHVLLSASRLDAPPRIVDLFILAPLGVLPGFRSRGIGTRLLERTPARSTESLAGARERLTRHMPRLCAVRRSPTHQADPVASHRPSTCPLAERCLRPVDTLSVWEDRDMRLILIRHGQTTSNVGGLLDTAEPGAGLTGLGFVQAAALPDALGGESIEVLYASTLVRARQTAAPLAASLGLDVRVRDGLREVRAGTLEMRGDAAAVHLYRDTTFAWSAGDVDVRMPGAESGAEVYARYDAVIDEIALSGVGTCLLYTSPSP